MMWEARNPEPGKSDAAFVARAGTRCQAVSKSLSPKKMKKMMIILNTVKSLSGTYTQMNGT